MKKTLTKDEAAVLVPIIKRVLETGKPWKDDLLHYPAGAIVSAVLTIPGVKQADTGDNGEGFSTNGWQWDWWQAFTYKEKEYSLSGSGFYGGHAFNLADE